jgi:cell wall-associated NlpC family hydrolase
MTPRHASLYGSSGTQYIGCIMGYKLLYSCAFLVWLAGCASVPPQPPAAPATAATSEAVFQALLTLGVDYKNGGRTPVTGFDCSGLIAHVYREAWGLRLPHNARAQSELGKAVGSTELQPGDLVFYNTLNQPFSHVGIYVGDGRFIHAPKSGQRVRMESIEAKYWRARFDGARRLEPPSTQN